MTEQGTPESSAADVHLPLFWTYAPQAWFIHAEAQFHIKKVSDDSTKYFYLVSALSPDTTKRVMRFIINSPAEDKYVTMKKALLRTFGLNKHGGAAKLLHLPELGDQLPSVRMAEMMVLAGEHTDCPMFEQAFREKLPEDVRLLLTDCSFKDPEAYAAKADALIAGKNKASDSINKVSTSVTTPQRRQDGATSPANSPKARQKDPHKRGWCYYHLRWEILKGLLQPQLRPHREARTALPVTAMDTVIISFHLSEFSQANAVDIWSYKMSLPALFQEHGFTELWDGILNDNTEWKRWNWMLSISTTAW
ncbi:uncharacterized protein LOC144599087 [Rhinoraja longicauda]